MPLQNSSGVAILVSLQECGFFSAYNRAQDNHLSKPQVKIRPAFHFVERNYPLLGTLSLCAFRIAPEFISRSSRTRDLRTNLLAFAIHFIPVIYVMLMRSNKPETAVYGSSIAPRYGFCSRARWWPRHGFINLLNRDVASIRLCVQLKYGEKFVLQSSPV